jgi:hypothetical protein
VDCVIKKGGCFRSTARLTGVGSVRRRRANGADACGTWQVTLST